MLPWKQWAAVAIHSGDMSEPAQNCVPLRSNATCHGHDPGTLGRPPTILFPCTMGRLPHDSH